VIRPGERHLIDARVRRLNDLGFDVEEFELVRTPEGDEIRVQPLVIDEGHHFRRLNALTGLRVQENQARRLLADIDGYRAWLSREAGTEVPEAVGAYRWLTEIFEPAVNRVPIGLRNRLPPAELFHEILEHRYYMGQELDREVFTLEAVDDYVENVLRDRTEELAVLPDTDDDDLL
jgi:hypothetical protein